jgi:hypothetical protein
MDDFEDAKYLNYNHYEPSTTIAEHSLPELEIVRNEYV